MTAVLAPHTVVSRAPVARRPLRSRARALAAAHGEALGLLALTWAAYIAIAAMIVFRYDAVPLDSVSRLDDGASVIYSSSPHLAAVGFVWNPLPSLTEIPLLLVKNIWPALLARGFAAGIMSGLFMAAAVVGVRGILADRGAGRIARLGLPLLFAGMPYVLIYGGDGLSEAFFVCFLVWATRSFLRYVARDESGDLVSAGLYLGLAYLSRYEAAAAAAGAALLLVLVVVGNPRRANPEAAARPADRPGAGHRAVRADVRRLGGGQHGHRPRPVPAVLLRLRELHPGWREQGVGPCADRPGQPAGPLLCLPPALRAGCVATVTL